MQAGTTLRRHDIYAFIHKALRLAMSDALAALGRLDASDAEEVSQALVRARDLADFCQHHVVIENAFVHPAMEARRSGSTARAGLDLQCAMRRRLREHDRDAAARADVRDHVDSLRRRHEHGNSSAIVRYAATRHPRDRRHEVRARGGGDDGQAALHERGVDGVEKGRGHAPMLAARTRRSRLACELPIQFRVAAGWPAKRCRSSP
jgi:hypothetical protein